MKSFIFDTKYLKLSNVIFNIIQRGYMFSVAENIKGANSINIKANWIYMNERNTFQLLVHKHKGKLDLYERT